MAGVSGWTVHEGLRGYGKTCPIRPGGLIMALSKTGAANILILW